MLNTIDPGELQTCPHCTLGVPVTVESVPRALKAIAAPSPVYGERTATEKGILYNLLVQRIGFHILHHAIETYRMGR